MVRSRAGNFYDTVSFRLNILEAFGLFWGDLITSVLILFMCLCGGVDLLASALPLPHVYPVNGALGTDCQSNAIMARSYTPFWT